MKLVVKIGGAALENEQVLQKCAFGVAELAKDGHQMIVVHGGGSMLTRTLKRLGKESEFIQGLRVTDAETRDVALMVLAGIVNKKLVRSIQASGKPALGLCGGDGGSFLARKKKTAGADLGYVGEICAVEARWIKAIVEQGGIPVISSISLGTDGEYYNVNADQMASACAAACQADALIFLTDVPGVRGSDGAILRWLNLKEVPSLVESAVISGGMLPKLEACTEALRRGVGRVRIMPAEQADKLSEFYLTRMEFGTEVCVA